MITNVAGRYAIAFIKRKEESDTEKSQQKQEESTWIKITMANFLKVNKVGQVS